MARQLTRHDFLIKDLAITVSGGSGGGTWMPGPDEPTPPTPISPIAAVLAHTAHFEGVRAIMVDAIKAENFDEISLAFIPGEAGGSPAIRAAIEEIGAAVVASAAFASLGGSVGLIDPNCGGTSFETIPPTLTPVVHKGISVHRVTELPRLRRQLAMTVEYLDKAAEVQAPRRDEVKLVRAELEGALKQL